MQRGLDSEASAKLFDVSKYVERWKVGVECEKLCYFNLLSSRNRGYYEYPKKADAAR
jgi:hypothetical protein